MVVQGEQKLKSRALIVLQRCQEAVSTFTCNTQVSSAFVVSLCAGFLRRVSPEPNAEGAPRVI